MNIQNMQGIKLCEHGWKLIEFDDVYTMQRVLGTYDTIENALKNSHNIILPLYTVTSKKVNGYKCLICRYQEKYIGAIYIQDKLVYLDPNTEALTIGIRKEWKTKKEIIRQLYDFTGLLENQTCCGPF